MMTHPDAEKKKTIQTYNPDAANVNSSMLVLSVICLVLPDVLFESWASAAKDASVNNHN